jgi:gamma-glutamyltranspeptidase/glutathione hydrolase
MVMNGARFARLCSLIIVLVVVPLAWGASLPPVTGHGGAVASAAPAATAAGIEMLEAGGNAADAAVATALVLAVVHPQAGNLGGGGFAVARFGDDTAALDFRETAPAAATRDMYLDEGGEPVRRLSLVGALAAGVPGSPSGLHALHERYGALPWSEVVTPAERLAREGFVVTQRLHDSLSRPRVVELLSQFEEARAVWLPGGDAPPAGSVMRLPALAATLAVYAEHGPRAITHGPAAAAVELASERYGGVLTAADLGAYKPVWKDPITFSVGEWTAASMPLPSSGGIILAETFALLERLGWAATPRFGADRAHLLAETWRRVYADRFLLGDPSTTEAGADDLLDPRWMARRAAAIDPLRATPSASVQPFSERALQPEPTETTHLSVVDGSGNAVSLTTTLNGSYGCGVLVPGAGFFLNNEMDDFAVKPGRPNLYGLIQGEANAVRPGKRMLSSMSPTVLWREGGRAVLAVGSPGGSRIPTSTAQVVLSVVVEGDDLQAAVNRPRIHHQWLPDEIVAEADALSPETRAELVRRGHAVRTVDAMCEVCAAARLEDGTSAAAADPRGPGAAAVAEPSVSAVAGGGQ